jgi:hypothetical protein
VGCSGARAGGTSEGRATALRVLGLTLAGGSASDGSRGSGALLSLPLDPVLDLAVAGWSADSREAGSSSSATSRSALLDLGLLGGHLAAVSLLESGSVAGAGPRGTEGAASSTGLDIRLLDGLDVAVLRSSATSDGDRSAQLLALNGAGILGSGRTHRDGGTDGSVGVDVPGVVDLQLLDTFATGGSSSGTVLGISDLLGSGPVGSLVTSSAGGATTLTGVLPPSPALPVASGVTPPVGGIAASSGVAASTTPVTAAAGPGPRTPLTGTAAGLAGLLLAGLGALMVALSLRARRAHAAA